jgi:hypothetical protein
MIALLQLVIFTPHTACIHTFSFFKHHAIPKSASKDGFSHLHPTHSDRTFFHPWYQIYRSAAKCSSSLSFLSPQVMPMLRLLQLGLVLFAFTPGHQGAHAETTSAKKKPFQAYREMAAEEALAAATQPQDGASGEQMQTKVSMAGGTIYFCIGVYKHRGVCIEA